MTGNIYDDAFNYVKLIAPIILLIGACSFADLIITTLIEQVKKVKSSIKW